ncbi:type III-B CRISPR module-associated protein Cmr5 [Rubeoparvulum massiliense]|uniref:type III-B CRISPR module-associated protein Cmr5 n=1 Tax=Rubeoparvulum massiliense TaxID=1631346 RepID=UPI00065E746D|nr:type III-B CRISPR module-associated protein Cmr5 [Rubeoparvulum massiliense]
MKSNESKSSLEQERSRHSLTKIEEIQTKYRYCAKEYAEYVERLPANILMNGLGQALAQLLAASKRSSKNSPQDSSTEQEKLNKESPYYLLYRHLEEWLCEKNEYSPYYQTKEEYEDDKEIELLQALIRHDQRHYQLAQIEALQWLEWHKKLAITYLKAMDPEESTERDSHE